MRRNRIFLVDFVQTLVDSGQKVGVDFSKSNYISYPQQDEIFGIDINIRSIEWQGPSFLSLVDFSEATVIIYFEVPVMQCIMSKIDQEPGIDYRRVAAMQYEDSSIDFYLNSGRKATVLHLKKKDDNCSSYPYFIGKVTLY